MRFPLARTGGREVPDHGHAFGVESIAPPLGPPLLGLLALTLPLAIAFGILALAFRGPAFFTGIPSPITIGLGRPCKRVGSLDLRANLRGRVNAAVTGVAAKAWGVGGSETLPTRPVGDDILELGICRHPQSLAEDVTRVSMLR